MTVVNVTFPAFSRAFGFWIQPCEYIFYGPRPSLSHAKYVPVSFVRLPAFKNKIK